MISIVTKVKIEATGGYNAVQVGFRRVRDRKLTKPEMGHLQKVGAIPMHHLQEFRLVCLMIFSRRVILLMWLAPPLERVFKVSFFVFTTLVFFFFSCTSFLIDICFKFLKFCSFFLCELCFG